MNKIKRLEAKMNEELETVREELIQLTMEIGRKQKALREAEPPTTSAGRAKRRDLEEEILDLQAKQKTVHHEWSAGIQNRYLTNIKLLKDKMNRLEVMQQRFIERMTLGMWSKSEDPHRLARDMRPLAEALEIDLDAWLATYNYVPKPEVAPVYAK